MKKRIGYFAPEFPGQTHIFLWRERQALAELGIEADVVSTRCPPLAVASHSWTKEAQENTVYLVPVSFQDIVNICIELIIAGPIAWFRCLNLIVHAYDTTFVQKIRLLVLVFFAAKLVRLAKVKGWQHIHVPSCADAANIAMFASILGGFTYSLSLLGPTLEGYGPNQEQKWQHSAFALVISETLSKVVNERLGHVLPEQVVIASVGVDIEEIKRRNAYAPWQSGICKLYCCGRLNPVKGYKYLIETVALLRQRGFDVRLQIAGEDEKGGTGYRCELEKLIQEQAMSDYIELIGAVSEARNRQGLENAHLFVLASLNEGISVAVMEAMAMEMPVIVTDVGGNYELIDNGVNAILVQPAKPEEMADAITKVLQDPELALHLSQESRKKVATKFHHRVSAEALSKCLEALV